MAQINQMQRSHKNHRSAFTLVELLVVIAIIGILVSLLLPAVQSARESARRMQCLNHLKQMGLAFQMHHDTYKHLPTGGWGWNYVGDPDDGFGENQPGGWTYNILPYMEQGNLHDIGKGTVGPLKQTELARLVSFPISFYHCPSRRGANAYPITVQPTNAAHVDVGAKLDYAVNCGDQNQNEWNGGAPPAGNKPPAGTFTGIVYCYSTITLAQVKDGTSNTIMVGEKYLNPDNYENGVDAADNENLYVGFDNDNARSTHPTGAYPPRRDTRKLTAHIFGSAHPSGWNVVLCDGSVRPLSYTIDKVPFQRLGNRADGLPVDMSN